GEGEVLEDRVHGRPIVPPGGAGSQEAVPRHGPGTAVALQGPEAPSGRKTEGKSPRRRTAAFSSEDDSKPFLPAVSAAPRPRRSSLFNRSFVCFFRLAEPVQTFESRTGFPFA